MAQAALPAVTVSEVTTPLTNTTQHTGVTATAACGSGTLVGGGSYLRNVANPATLPTNGLVLGGQSPSTGAAPVDAGVAGGATDPTHWLTDANFTGVADPANTDQVEAFALCAVGGTAHTVVASATTSGAADNANQQVSPPVPATATCPSGTQLIGGGAATSTPDQINDGATVGNSGNLKPLASYPSNAAGVAAGDGSTAGTSWSAYGSAGMQNGGGGADVVTAYALCSTDASRPPVEVARVDVAGPAAQAGTTTTTGSATCPAGTQLIGGGYGADETVGSTSGLQPQQGYHMRGSYPTTSAATSSSGTPPTEVASGAVDPETWTALLQLGGQTLPAGDFGVLHVYAMCATAPGPPGSADLSVSLAATPNPVLVGQPLTYTMTLVDAGPAAATDVVASESLPAAAAFVSATSSAGSCAQSAGTVTCAIGNLATGAPATVTVVVTPTQAVPQTASATVSGSQPDANSSDNSASSTTPANLATRATPTLTAQATGATLGGAISDQVTLAGGSGATGAITFNLYGPGDTTCTVALATSSAPVSGDAAYSSAPYTTSTAGTYRWIAAYGGDGANAPVAPGACGQASQTVAVRAAPTLSVKALGASTAGARITSEATLAGGALVTGTITSSLYGPGDGSCTQPLATTTAAVSGDGIYGSNAFTATRSGTYRWVAVYAGDALNAGTATACGAPDATLTLSAAAALPSSRFTITAPTASRAGRISFVVKPPGRGAFRAVATFVVGAKERSKPIRFGSRAMAARAAGHFTLAITPGARANALLREHTSLRVTIAVTFTPTGGKPRTRDVHVTVKGARKARR